MSANLFALPALPRCTGQVPKLAALADGWLYVPGPRTPHVRLKCKNWRVDASDSFASLSIASHCAIHQNSMADSAIFDQFKKKTGPAALSNALRIVIGSFEVPARLVTELASRYPILAEGHP